MKQSISERALERAAETLQRVHHGMTPFVNSPPFQRKLSRAEKLREINSLPPEDRLALAQQMGTDGLLDMMRELGAV